MNGTMEYVLNQNEWYNGICIAPMDSKMEYVLNQMNGTMEYVLHQWIAKWNMY